LAGIPKATIEFLPNSGISDICVESVNIVGSIFPEMPIMNHVTNRSSRRDFIKQVAAGSAGYWIASTAIGAESNSANEKLNIGIIGAGGQGAGNLRSLSHQNIVALCDVDDRRAAGSFEGYPKAKRFRDFRKMLDECRELDAVVVSTPDHTHAVAAVAAMRLGKHVYCEKPLAHSVHEARLMRDTARQHRVATQMGNGAHASEQLRRVVEVVQSGQIGPVGEAHCWSDRPIWPQGIDRPVERQPVPDHLDWDLWLGPAPERPYHEAYLPFKWRGWWDFGTGALGDMGCHIIDVPFWALKLEYPTAVEAEVSGRHSESAPLWSIVRYEFPSRGGLPPVRLTWYDGKKMPPAELVPGVQLPSNGTLLIGEKATLLVPHGREKIEVITGSERTDLSTFKDPEPFLPRSSGHHQEWVDACKGGPAALSNFDYAAQLTETVLLGNVACRAGKRIEWNAQEMAVKDCPEAASWIRREYRTGWSL
jgi:predicted dehydrogenase